MNLCIESAQQVHQGKVAEMVNSKIYPSKINTPKR